MIDIYSPMNLEKERKYVYELVFSNYIGVEYRLILEKRTNICLRKSGKNNNIYIHDEFFKVGLKDWLTTANIPDKKNVIIDDKKIEDIKCFINVNKKADSLYLIENKSTFINWDLFGVIFFLVTRYEEVVTNNLDKYSRFSLTNSFLHQFELYKHPLVDQYISILIDSIKRSWSDCLVKFRSNYTLNVTHDIDLPYRYWKIPFKKNLSRILKSKLGSSPESIWKQTKNWANVNFGGGKDPYFCFDEIMKISEKANLVSKFYFMCGQTSIAHDPKYDIRSKKFTRTLQDIHNRGHEIGFHPSFNTYNSPELLAKEFSVLMETCKNNGIKQSRWGGRQHFLRCKVPDTFRYLEQIGTDYDSTLGFAEAPGFRCGTCRPFPVYDLQERKTLSLIEYPLIVMEASVLDERYLGLSKNLPEAFNTMKDLKEKCQKYSGIFTLLWHNNRLEKPEEKELYKAILNA